MDGTPVYHPGHPMNRKDKALVAYLAALNFIESQGFSREVDWARERSISRVTPVYFLEETAWVVLSSGMRESVVRRAFPGVRHAFDDFIEPSAIAREPVRFVQKACRWFNHPGKLGGIAEAAAWLADEGIEGILSSLEADGPDALRRIPFVGPVTSLHLAKNLGLPIAKPDRHLVRIAAALGFSSPDALCASVSSRTGEHSGLVDLVLWRFATLTQGYEEWLRDPTGDLPSPVPAVT